MNRTDLYRSFSEIDDDILERSEKDARSKLEATVFPRSLWHIHWKKVVAIAAMTAVILATAIPSLAVADVDFAYQAIYAVSPYFAQQLKPVHKSCVSNGIKLEVISASVENDTVKVLVAMNDLEQDRIDETVDLFDSYSIRNSYDSTGTCSLECYDAVTGTAIFSILLQQMNEVNFSTDKITFSVSEFLSHKNNFSGILSDVSLSQVETAPAIDHQVEIRGESWENEPENPAFLKPSSKPLSSPVEGVELTALGYVDGQLHIQTYYHNILETDNHGRVSLVSTDGTTYEASNSACFWDKSHCGIYQEYVFSLPQEALDTCQIYGEFTTCGQLTTGDWEITFPLSEVSS